MEQFSPARRVACARRTDACCASSQQRASAAEHKRAARASHPTKCKPELARESPVLHRRRAASRSFSALLWFTKRSPLGRRGVRAQQARVMRLLPRESQRSGAQAHYTRKPTREVRTRAGTREPCLAPKKGGFSLVQCPSMIHEAITARAARRASTTSACASPPPQREPAQWRASALHAQAASRSEDKGWHVGARPCTEEGRLFARAVPVHGT